MEKMKNVKQQMMTVFGLALILMTIAVCAPNQAFAQQRMRKSTSAQGPQRNKDIGSYSYNVGPNIQDRNKAAKPSHFAGNINWGDGASSTGAAGTQRQSANGFMTSDPHGPIYTNARQNANAQRNRPAADERSTQSRLQSQTKMPGASTKEFDKGYLSPYASNSYTGTTTVNQGTLNNLTLNGGSGNDTLRTANVQRPPQAVQGNFIGTNLIGTSGGVWKTTNLRQNSATSSELTNGNRASGLLATTYGRGSFNGMQGHPGNDFKSHRRPAK